MENLRIERVSLLIFIQYMASETNIPPNSLGSYLTKIGLPSIEIHLKTSIPTDEISKLRSGDIQTITAKKLFLIAKIRDIPMHTMLKNVYPDLKLESNTIKESRTDFKSMQDFFEYIDLNIINILSEKTGITPYRIKTIKNIEKSKINPGAHQLYLIELATKIKPGTLFYLLYKDLELNSEEEQERLRAENKGNI